MNMDRGKKRFILALLAVAMAGLIVAALIFIAIPEGNREPLLLALGLVLGLAVTAFNFYFGSSQGSTDKTEMLMHRPTGEPGDPVHVEEETPDDRIMD